MKALWTASAKIPADKLPCSGFLSSVELTQGFTSVRSNDSLESVTDVAKAKEMGFPMFRRVREVDASEIQGEVDRMMDFRFSLEQFSGSGGQ